MGNIKAVPSSRGEGKKLLMNHVLSLLLKKINKGSTLLAKTALLKKEPKVTGIVHISARRMEKIV